MPIKLKLPAGIVNKGTGYADSGLWTDCDLMRWDSGVLKTIGGWQSWATMPVDPANEAARAIGCITLLSGGVQTIIGTNQHVWSLSDGGTFTDITPAGFVAKSKDAQPNGGYGNNTYGTAKYGTPRPSSSAALEAVFSWALAAWGEILLAAPRGITGGTIKKKAPTDATLLPLTNTPTGIYDFTVTDERMVMAVGTDGDHRLVTWSDQEDYEEWIPAVTNTAGSYRLAGTGHLLAIRKIQNQLLIIGMNDAFVAQYVGPPYVYGFNRIGDKCGAVSATAIATISSAIYWFSGTEFWMFDGALHMISCPVMDYFIADLNHDQRSKTFAFANTEFGEIWWLYQSNNATECDKYLAYNYEQDIWYYGTINRTCGTNAAELRYLTLVGNDGIIYNHEQASSGYDGATPYIQSGPLETENGGRLLGMSYVFPDDTASQLNMEVQIRDMPKNPPLHTMTFTLSSPTSTTGVMGRDLRLRFSSVEPNEPWTLGDVRVEPLKSVTGRR